MQAGVAGVHETGFSTEPLPDSLSASAERFTEVAAWELSRLAACAGGVSVVDRERIGLAHRRWMDSIGLGATAAAQAAALGLALLREGAFVRFQLAPDGERPELASLLHFWPEGVAALQLAMRAYATGRLPDRIRPMRRIGALPLWWSIRENLSEEPGLAQPYLQLLAGELPNWQYWAAAC